MIVPIALAGAGVGVGVWLISLGARSRPSLSEVGSRLEVPGRTAEAGPVATRTVLENRATERMTYLLQTMGMNPSRRASDLRVARRTVEQHVLAKLTWSLGVGMFMLLIGLLLSGVFGMTPAVLLWVMGTVLGFYVPEMSLTGEASEARKAFRHAYGGYLDLVNVMLAAGAGPESALQTAADSGAGWAFAEIRGALSSARRTRRSVAEAFSELGRELEITELEELAASMALVGRQGARVRSTLGTKADALRAQQLAETEAEAEAATERMAVPVALLLLGFVVLLAYPAVTMISQAGNG